MSAKADQAIAFDRPGGDRAVPSRARPIDLVHLARQTLGDRVVEQEVLGMFAQQIGMVRERISKAQRPERCQLAHALKGSARGVGAFALADCADAIESEPGDEALLRRLAQLVDEARDFIAAINR